MGADTTHFRCLTFDRFAATEADHPAVQQLSDADIHKPISKADLTDNPDIFDGFPFYFYGIENDRIVSSVSLLPDRLFGPGIDCRWGWTGALLTSPSHRGRGLGTRIVKQVANTLAERELATGGAFTDEIRLFRRAEHVIPGFGSRYLYIRNATPLLNYHLPTRGLSWLLGSFYNAGMSCLSRIRPPRQPSSMGLSFKEEDIDTLLSNGVSFDHRHYDSPLHFNDSLDKLAWKMRGRPPLRLYLLRENDTSRILAYCILKDRHLQESRYLGRYRDLRLMTMMDFGIFDPDRDLYRVLLNAVLHHFLESGGDVLDLISTCSPLNSAAQKIGMIKVGKGMTFHYAPTSACTMPEEANSMSNWHLTHFCSDGFTFP